MSLAIPEREPGNFTPAPEYLEYAYGIYLDSLVTLDAEDLSWSSHELGDSGALFTERLLENAHSLVNDVHSGGRPPQGMQGSAFLTATKSYVYGMREIKPDLILKPSQRLGIGQKFLEVQSNRFGIY